MEDFLQYVDSAEAAEILGCHKNYVSYLCRSKDNKEYGLKTAVKRGRDWFIQRSEVEDRKKNPPPQGWPTRAVREKRSPRYEDEIGRAEVSAILGNPGKPLSAGYTVTILRREIRKKKNLPSLRRNERGEYLVKKAEVEAFARKRKNVETPSEG